MADKSTALLLVSRRLSRLQHGVRFCLRDLGLDQLADGQEDPLAADEGERLAGVEVGVATAGAFLGAQVAAEGGDVGRGAHRPPPSASSAQDARWRKSGGTSPLVATTPTSAVTSP